MAALERRPHEQRWPGVWHAVRVVHRAHAWVRCARRVDAFARRCGWRRWREGHKHGAVAPEKAARRHGEEHKQAATHDGEIRSTASCRLPSFFGPQQRVPRSNPKKGGGGGNKLGARAAVGGPMGGCGVAGGARAPHPGGRRPPPRGPTGGWRACVRVRGAVGACAPICSEGCRKKEMERFGRGRGGVVQEVGPKKLSAHCWGGLGKSEDVGGVGSGGPTGAPSPGGEGPRGPTGATPGKSKPAVYFVAEDLGFVFLFCRRRDCCCHATCNARVRARARARTPRTDAIRPWALPCRGGGSLMVAHP